MMPRLASLTGKVDKPLDEAGREPVVMPVQFLQERTNLRYHAGLLGA